MTKVNKTEYFKAVDTYTGWCLVCKKFTRNTTEPDAENYDCPVCKTNSVMGAEQAILTGKIYF